LSALTLAVSEILEVGDCIVGGIKVARFTVTNRGGAGRFVLMAADSWPCSSAMVCVHSVTSTDN